MTEKRYHLAISGRVQGVLFRFNAKRNADKLGIFGWVRNREDDTVEVVCQGGEDKVDKFIEWCRKGPLFAKVTDIRIKKEDVNTTEFQSFSIRY